MHKRNALKLLAVLGVTALWMVALHLLLFPRHGMLGISGVGMTGVALMMINREWLYPAAPPIPRQALQRSLLLAGVLGTSFSLLFGALGG